MEDDNVSKEGKAKKSKKSKNKKKNKDKDSISTKTNETQETTQNDNSKQTEVVEKQNEKAGPDEEGNKSKNPNASVEAGAGGDRKSGQDGDDGRYVGIIQTDPEPFIPPIIDSHLLWRGYTQLPTGTRRFIFFACCYICGCRQPDWVWDGIEKGKSPFFGRVFKLILLVWIILLIVCFSYLVYYLLETSQVLNKEHTDTF